MHRFVRNACLGLAVVCLGFSGCGDAEPPASAKSEAPKPAPPPTAPKAKGKGKKGGNPTADMDLKEVREYRKKQREEGKTP